VKLYSRPGNDLTARFPLIVEALARLRAGSCIVDGEAVACGDDGIALFERIRYRRFDSSVFMYAFDLIELNGDDLRREPLNGASQRWSACWLVQGPVCSSTSTWRPRGRWCSSMRVGWASKGSCRSARVRGTAQGARGIG
jgi:bifunctional non-homologous end joining protein LigD